MTTAKKAEEYVRNYFRRKKGLDLHRGKKGCGCDFISEDDKLCVEVKGTRSDKLTENPFHYFTDAELRLAKSCLKDGRDFQVHFVAAVHSKQPIHYIVPVKRLLDTAKSETVWSLPIRKDFDKYRVICNSEL